MILCNAGGINLLMGNVHNNICEDTLCFCLVSSFL